MIPTMHLRIMTAASILGLRDPAIARGHDEDIDDALNGDPAGKTDDTVKK